MRKMDNKINKYFEKLENDWHEYKIGTYHISAVGSSHADLEPEEHTGPCLRRTYWDYLDLEPQDEIEGNLLLGIILHEFVQTIYKNNNPACIIEYPIILDFEEGEIKIKIRGSVDILDFNEEIPYVLDIKTASPYLFPSSPYDMNPSYKTQVILYTYLLQKFIFKAGIFNPKKIKIVYIKKASPSLKTVELEADYDEKEAKLIFEDFLKRAFYLHECLEKKNEPVAEPHKWCKYCDHLDHCIENKDVMKIKEGRKTRIIKYHQGDNI